MKFNKNLRDKLISIFLFVLLVSVVYFIYGPRIIEVLNAERKPHQAPLIVSELSPQMELVTEYQNSYVRQMVLEDGLAYIGGSLNEHDLIALLSLDPITQQINWKTRPSSQIITIDSNRVYIWGDAGEVIAYDKITGMKVWQEIVDRRFPIIDALTITPIGLLVESRNPSGTRYHLVDLETGEKIRSFQTEADKNDFWLQNSLSVITSDYDDIVTAQGTFQWQNHLNLKSYPSTTPLSFLKLISTDSVILAYKESYSITQIVALSKTNGNFLLQIEVDNISNLVAAKDTLFFITRDALMGVDINTGQTTKYITFSPGVQGDSRYGSHVKIAADTDQILIYFNSSKQLFVFRFMV